VFPDGAFPPIEVVEVGGLYFVSDGHHRVALARERGADLFVWAYERRRDLRVFDPSASWADAASYMAREGGRRDRRVIESEAATPLNPRPERST
jgi:hypothetical protein